MHTYYTRTQPYPVMESRPSLLPELGRRQKRPVIEAKETYHGVSTDLSPLPLSILYIYNILYIYTHTHTHTHTHACIHICTYVYMYTYQDR